MWATYSKTFKCMFIPIAKNASTSLQTWMYSLEGLDYKPLLGKEGMQRTITISLQEFNESFNDYLVFTCVRNPFERLVSCYLDKFVRYKFHNGCRKEAVGSPALGAYNRNRENFDRLEKIALEESGGKYEDGISFETFLKTLEPDLSSDRGDEHWGLQYQAGYFDEINYSKICRFENFKSDIKALERILDIPAEKEFDVFKNRRASAQDGLLDASSSTEKAYPDYCGHLSARSLSQDCLYEQVTSRNFYHSKTAEIFKEKYRKDLETFKYNILD